MKKICSYNDLFEKSKFMHIIEKKLHMTHDTEANSIFQYCIFSESPDLLKKNNQKI